MPSRSDSWPAILTLSETRLYVETRLNIAGLYSIRILLVGLRFVQFLLQTMGSEKQANIEAKTASEHSALTGQPTHDDDDDDDTDDCLVYTSAAQVYTICMIGRHHTKSYEFF